MRFSDIKKGGTYYGRTRKYSSARTKMINWYTPYFVLSVNEVTLTVLASCNGGPAKIFTLGSYKGWVDKKPEDEGVATQRITNKSNKKYE